MTFNTSVLTEFKPLSTNATGNWVLLLIFAVGALFGIGEEPILAAVPIVLLIREIIVGTRKPRWAGNILTYVISAIVIVAPWLGGTLDVIKPIIEVVLGGGDARNVWPLFIPLINQVIILIQTKPWQKPAL